MVSVAETKRDDTQCRAVAQLAGNKKASCTAPATLQGLLWTHYRKAHSRASEATVMRLHYVVRSVDRFTGRLTLVDDLTEELFNRWVEHRENLVSASTAYHNRVDFLTLWRWASAAGYCSTPLPSSLHRVSAEQRNDAADQSASGLTLRQLLWDRYVPSRQNLKPSSAKLIEYSVRSFQRYVTRPVLVEELSEDFVMPFLAHRRRTVSLETAKREASNLLCLWRFALRKRLCDNPLPEDWEPIRLTRKIPRAWSLEEFGRILDAASHRAGMFRTLPVHARDFWTALLLFLYESGARIGATMCMETADVVLPRAQAILRADFAKTGIESVVDLSPEAVIALQAIYDPNRRVLFDWPYARRQLWLDYRDIVVDAGLETVKGEGFHKIRRTSATQAVIAAGWDHARVALGHSQEAMTRRYVDLRQVPRPKIHLPLPSIVQTTAAASRLTIAPSDGRPVALIAYRPDLAGRPAEPIEPVDSRLWEFRRGGWAQYGGGKWLRINSRWFEALKVLAAGTVIDTNRVQLLWSPSPTDPMPPKAIGRAIGKLRNWLRRVMDAPAGFDPLPSAGKQPTRWRLQQPSASVSDHQVPSPLDHAG
ncbi:site-specific tyrosine recombinase XerD [Caulifigura coniformis]|uniref:Site-specific tyrosine recombinase XerD n=1 Tax=Caulifigura coniformis TaxID=2527983 RepID=A0A517SHI9_9PLAN|nr:tyrosine-type recombinase/integrase [Caulifigura coniformis]QDT55585.1 site-specific tyrosine recombinase XerD [Caulifigura coniformis]